MDWAGGNTDAVGEEVEETLAVESPFLFVPCKEEVRLCPRGVQLALGPHRQACPCSHPRAGLLGARTDIPSAPNPRPSCGIRYRQHPVDARDARAGAARGGRQGALAPRVCTAQTNLSRSWSCGQREPRASQTCDLANALPPPAHQACSQRLWSRSERLGMGGASPPSSTAESSALPTLLRTGLDPPSPHILTNSQRKV